MPEYYGRKAGEVLGLGISIGEIIVGGDTAATGGGLAVAGAGGEVLTGSAATPVSVPAMAAGGGLIVVGAAATTSGILGVNNFMTAQTPKPKPNASASPQYEMKPADMDWRGTGKTWRDALDEAFKKTGISKEDFKVTKWAKDANGKSHPVEWRHDSGAEVNMDWPHAKNGPDAAHVGWQTGGKRGAGGGERGHILVDEVPYNR